MRLNLGSREILILAAFVSAVDRSLLAPLLPVIAEDLNSSIDVIGIALTLSMGSYAVMQLAWGVATIRWGRARVLVISTALGGLANLMTAVAHDPTSLAISRTLAGAAFAATIPVVLVYFGDTQSMRERAVATANLAAALALGMTLGTLGASVLAEWAHWRFSFGALAALSVVGVVMLMRVPEVPGSGTQRFLSSIARLALSPWAVLVLMLAALEGAVFIGIFAYLPTSLQAQGESVVTSGLATAAYGAAVIVASQLMKLVIRAWPAWLMLLLGGTSSVAAFLILTVTISTFTTLLSATLLGIAWALAHTTLQTWMTDVVAGARAIGTALFAVLLFTGATLGTIWANSVADEAAFSQLFAGAAVAAALYTLCASIGRARYQVSDDPVAAGKAA